MRFPRLAGLALFASSLCASQEVDASNLRTGRKVDPVAQMANGQEAECRRSRLNGILHCLSTEEKRKLWKHVEAERAKEGENDSHETHVSPKPVRAQAEKKNHPNIEEEKQRAFAEGFISRNRADVCRIISDENEVGDFVNFIKYALRQGAESDVFKKLLPEVIASIGVEGFRVQFLNSILSTLKDDEQKEAFRKAVNQSVVDTCRV